MKIRIEIDCENVAFRAGNRSREVRRLLREADEHIPELWVTARGSKLAQSKGLMDINGNRVGAVTVEP
jgi:hypothetical protein